MCGFWRRDNYNLALFVLLALVVGSWLCWFECVCVCMRNRMRGRVRFVRGDLGERAGVSLLLLEQINLSTLAGVQLLHPR